MYREDADRAVRSLDGRLVEKYFQLLDLVIFSFSKKLMYSLDTPKKKKKRNETD